MRHCGNAHAAANRTDAHVRQRAAAYRREHELRSLESGQSLEQLHRPIGQRDAMYLARLHVMGRHRPELRLQINFRPRRVPDLAAARRRQDRELERSGAHPVALAQVRHELPDVLPRQRRVVLDLANLRWFRQRMLEPALPLRRVVARAVTADGRPSEHGLDALAHARRGLGLLGPYRLEHIDDLRDPDARHRQLAHDRARIGRQRRQPVIHMLRVAELVRLRLVREHRGLIERQRLRLCECECRLGGALRLDGIHAIRNLLSHHARPLARRTDVDVWVRAETHVTTLGTYLYTQHPRRREFGRHEQVQPGDAADGVEAGLRGEPFHLDWRENPDLRSRSPLSSRTHRSGNRTLDSHLDPNILFALGCDKLRRVAVGVSGK